MYELQPKKRSRGCLTVFGIAGILLTMFSACAFVLVGPSLLGQNLSDTLASSGAAPARDTSNVVYRIRSGAQAGRCMEFAVTYAMPGGTAQRDIEVCSGIANVDRFDGGRGDRAYLSIQNTAPRNSLARFSCVVMVDGEIVAETQSVGWANIASCSESLR